MIDNETLFVETPFDQIQFGDVVTIFAPYEENTVDYYNGHLPKSVRGDLYRDKDGRTGKSRPVMVLDCHPPFITYLPLTSSRTNEHDYKHQYQLIDNSALPHKPGEILNSYVEIDSVRTTTIPKNWNGFYKSGSISNDEQLVIRNLLNNACRKVVNGIDKRAFVSGELSTILSENLKNAGYEEIEKGYYKSYQKHDCDFRIYPSGLVHYHFIRTLDEIKAEFGIEDSDFVESVKQLTQEVPKNGYVT